MKINKKIDSLLKYELNNNIINIGDYVQSLAAKQFLNEPLQLLSREKLDLYKGEQTRLIMNGWFLHEITHWPPSKRIDPLFVSFHINHSALQIIDNQKSIDYFKLHEPIGCRDKFTVDLLKEKGIKSYFTGCLTLTLGETYYSENKNDNIYFVDPYIPNLSKNSYIKKVLLLINTLPYLTTNLKILKKMFKGKFTIGKYLLSSVFFKTYKSFFAKPILLNAEYISHLYSPDSFTNEEDIFMEAERLLKKYAGAKLVVTSRIHCALPSLGLKTPVIYTDNLEKDEISSCRLDGLLELFNTITIKDSRIIKKNMIDNIELIHSDSEVKNKKTYQKIKKELIEILNNNGFFIKK